MGVPVFLAQTCTPRELHSHNRRNLEDGSLRTTLYAFRSWGPPAREGQQRRLSQRGASPTQRVLWNGLWTPKGSCEFPLERKASCVNKVGSSRCNPLTLRRLMAAFPSLKPCQVLLRIQGPSYLHPFLVAFTQQMEPRKMHPFPQYPAPLTLK